MNCLLFVVLFAFPLAAQQDEPAESKRLFGIVPNFRTAPSMKDYHPLSPAGKFRIATQDSLDRGTFVLAGLSAGLSQWSTSSPSFGQGIKGYGHYYVTSYADFALGNYMAEAIFPTMLHQDPRYFRKGCCGWSRLGYALGQTIWTHNDSGKRQFNYSELGGNATAVAISTSWYPDNRNAADAATQFSTQVALDAMSNVLKEFWPEIARKLSRKPKQDKSPPTP